MRTGVKTMFIFFFRLLSSTAIHSTCCTDGSRTEAHINNGVLQCAEMYCVLAELSGVGGGIYISRSGTQFLELVVMPASDAHTHFGISTV